MSVLLVVVMMTNVIGVGADKVVEEKDSYLKLLFTEKDLFYSRSRYMLMNPSSFATNRNNGFSLEWIDEAGITKNTKVYQIKVREKVIKKETWTEDEVCKNVISNKTKNKEKVCHKITVNNGTIPISITEEYKVPYDYKAIKTGEIVILEVYSDMKPVLGYRYVDHIPSFYGFTYPEYDLWNGTWNYAVNITIQSSQVDESNEYQIYVNLADLGSNFFGNTTSDGRDIRVGVEGTQVNHELVNFDKGAETGELWFNTGSQNLSSVSNVNFTIYTNSTDASMPSENFQRSTWEKHKYQVVMHFNDDPTGDVNDSSLNAYVCDTSGSMRGGDLINTTIGKGLNLDGSNDYVFCNSISPGIDTKFTGVIWTDMEDNQDDCGIMGQENLAGTNNDWTLRMNDNKKEFGFYMGSGGNMGADNRPLGWYMIGMMYDGVNVKHRLNQTQDASGASSGSETNNYPLVWGERWSGQENHMYQGTIDEAWVINRSMSAGWLDTVYHILDNDGFYTVNNAVIYSGGSPPEPSGDKCVIDKSAYIAVKINGTCFYTVDNTEVIG